MPGKKLDEVRVVEAAQFRIADEQAHTIEGRAVPFNEWTPINGSYLERITSDTFAKSVAVAGDTIPLMVSHEHREWPVGKALEWESRDDGLYGLWQLDMKREQAAEAWRLASEGYVKGLSVGFQSNRDADDIDLDGDVPMVTRGPGARLLEVSMVAIAAYPGAQITKVRTAGVGGVVDPRIEATRRWLEEIRAGV